MRSSHVLKGKASHHTVGARTKSQLAENKEIRGLHAFLSVLGLILGACISSFEARFMAEISFPVIGFITGFLCSSAAAYAILSGRPSFREVTRLRMRRDAFITALIAVAMFALSAGGLKWIANLYFAS
jgi:hypothetical protein